jgi:hypothetical protein
VDCAVFLVVCDNTLADTVFHDQIGSEELDKVLGIVS